MSWTCPACGVATEPANRQPYPGASSDRPQIILICPKCGFGTADPMPTAEQLAEYYTGGYWQQAEIKPVRRADAPMPFLLATRRWASVDQALGQHHTRGLRLLDIGAGLGCLGLVAAASPRLADGCYAAVEPDRALRESLAISWRNPATKLMLHQDLAEVNNRFDVVFLSHILEHVPEPAALLTQALKRLEPGGIILVEVPHTDWRFKDDVYPHLGFFTVPAMQRLLERMDVEVIEVATWGRTDAWTQKPSLALRVGYRLARHWPFFSEPFYDYLYRTGQRRADGAWLRAVAKRKPAA